MGPMDIGMALTLKAICIWAMRMMISGSQEAGCTDEACGDETVFAAIHLPYSGAKAPHG